MKTIRIGVFLWCCGMAMAQQPDRDEVAVVELGGAGSWSINGGGAGSYGATAAVEVTPIEKWLELEGGVTRLFAGHSSEWDTDLLFKKPWKLSEKVEFMAGIGPEWVRTGRSNALAGEAVLDFMFWPAAKHRFGWYLEPGYDYSFAHGHEKSVGISGGLLIAFP